KTAARSRRTLSMISRISSGLGLVISVIAIPPSASVVEPFPGRERTTSIFLCALYIGSHVALQYMRYCIATMQFVQGSRTACNPLPDLTKINLGRPALWSLFRSRGGRHGAGRGGD